MARGIIESKRGKLRQEYLATLGEFVDTYASIESLVHHSFRLFAKMNSEMAMAIKGAMRLSDLMTLIKRVMVVKKWLAEDCAEISGAFEQLNVISEFRDRVLHRGATIEKEGHLQSSNLATMKSFDLAEFVVFKVSDIENAAADLRQIRSRIGLVLYRRKITTEFSRESIEAVRQPWLYRSLKRETMLQRVQREHQARAGRRKPSRQ